MSRSGRSGRPENRDTFSLLVLNVSFRATVDDLFPLFDRYGEVLDIHIPRDRRTGDPRGFAFVRYNYEDEAQDAIDGLDGMRFDGRALKLQFAKYGPNAEKIHRGRITEEDPYSRLRSRSRSPRPRYEQDRYKDSDHRRQRTHRISPDYDRKHSKRSDSPERKSPSHRRSRSPRKAPHEETPSKPKDGRAACSGSP